MPRILIDNSTPQFVFDDSSRLSDGMAKLFSDIVQTPGQVAQVRQQQERDAMAAAWKQREWDRQTGLDRAQLEHMQSADARAAMNDMFAGQDRQADNDFRAGRLKLDQQVADDNRAEAWRDDIGASLRYGMDQLFGKPGAQKPVGPQPNEVAPSHLVDLLSFEQVGVPAMDAYGQPMTRYEKRPRADAEARLRAAGIDPQTMRFAAPGAPGHAPAPAAPAGGGPAQPGGGAALPAGATPEDMAAFQAHTDYMLGKTDVQPPPLTPRQQAIAFQGQARKSASAASGQPAGRGATLREQVTQQARAALEAARGGDRSQLAQVLAGVAYQARSAKLDEATVRSMQLQVLQSAGLPPDQAAQFLAP